MTPAALTKAVLSTAIDAIAVEMRVDAPEIAIILQDALDHYACRVGPSTLTADRAAIERSRRNMALQMASMLQAEVRP